MVKEKKSKTPSLAKDPQAKDPRAVLQIKKGGCEYDKGTNHLSFTLNFECYPMMEKLNPLILLDTKKLIEILKDWLHGAIDDKCDLQEALRIEEVRFSQQNLENSLWALKIDGSNTSLEIETRGIKPEPITMRLWKLLNPGKIPMLIEKGNQMQKQEGLAEKSPEEGNLYESMFEILLDQIDKLKISTAPLMEKYMGDRAIEKEYSDLCSEIAKCKNDEQRDQLHKQADHLETIMKKRGLL